MALGVSVHLAGQLLGESILQGRAVVERAGFVGDLGDYESWKAARNQWIARTGDTLARIYPQSGEVERFKGAASVSSGGRWQMEYTRQLDCARVAVEVVVSLRAGLGLPPVPALDSSPPAEPAGVEDQHDEDHAGYEPAQEQPDDFLAQDPHVQPEAPPGESALGAGSPVRSELAAVTVAGSLAATESAGGSELVEQGSSGSVSPAYPDTQAGGPRVDRSRQVFLVHGRNEQVRQAVAHLLERTGAHDVTILNERPSDRKLLVEQFEHGAAGSRYAIVLLTADDVGAPRLDSEHEPYFSPRARQGVVFEMGFLVAALTPRCVCVLYEDGVELPCDLEGIAYIRLDLSGTWQSKLLLALRGAGFDYDLNSLAPV